VTAKLSEVKQTPSKLKKDPSTPAFHTTERKAKKSSIFDETPSKTIEA